jgi:hypothetical protein
MRMASLVFALLLCACETAPPGSTAPAPDPALAEAELAEAKALPDFRPESATACNAVRLDVSVSATGALSINGAATDMDGLKAAAQRKNAACLNAPAMVLFNTQAGAPAAARQAALDTLSGIIVNLGVVETTN